mmetsp:Transcript_3296/g.9882  ORF Transcript_3296/g.9882 Transcript_3296/m.9882 type:complete len:237 (+) Transcript_3296:105-815(+)
MLLQDGLDERGARGHRGAHLGHAGLEQLGRLEVVDGKVLLVRRVALLRLGRVDLQALQQLRQAHVVLGVEHGAALGRGEAVAEDVDDVDVGRPRGEALVQDLEALVDQREEEALEDLLLAHGAGRDALGLADLLHLGDDLGVDHLVAAAVDEDAAAGGLDLGVRRLLAEAALLAEPVHELVGPEVGLRLLLHVTSGLALLPEELLTHEVAQGHGPHGHAELHRRPVDGLDAGALLE